MSVEFEVVESPEQLRRWIDLHNANDPFEAVPFEFQVEQDANRTQAQLRLLATGGGADLMCGRVGCSPSGTAATIRIVRDCRAPVSHMAAMSSQLEAWAVEQGVTKLLTMAYSFADEERAMWSERGWAESERKPVVVLDVARASAPAAPDISGIEFTDLGERPGLERAIYQAYVDSWASTPWASPSGIPTFERWLGNIQRWPGSAPGQFLIALDGDRVAGYAELDFGAAGDRRSIWNGFTGVRPGHRRRGIARCLKLRGIEWARARGIERIYASNDADNHAMRSINAQLGYEPAFEYVGYERLV